MTTEAQLKEEHLKFAKSVVKLTSISDFAKYFYITRDFCLMQEKIEELKKGKANDR